MLTDYENKLILPKKTYKERKDEAKKRHEVEIIVDGHSAFVGPGERVRFRDGKVYEVNENGSPRRVKQ